MPDCCSFIAHWWGATWDLAAADLAGGGYQVGVPDLTGTVATGPPYCLRQAEVIVGNASGESAILIGHSGAGPLLAGAGGIIGQVRGYVFADAGLPTPGRAGWTPCRPGWPPSCGRWPMPRAGYRRGRKWWGEEALAELLPDPDVRRRLAAGCPRLPLAMFEEVHPSAPQWPDGPAAYLQLSEAYADQAAQAWQRGWPVTRLAVHHLALVTDPGLVAGSLRELLSQLQRKP